MPYGLKGAEKWTGMLSDSPTLLTSSDQSYWNGAEFQEIVFPCRGHVDGPHKDIMITWVHKPMKIRWLGKKNFEQFRTGPFVSMPDNHYCGDWEGSSHSLCLFVPKDFADQVYCSNVTADLGSQIEMFSDQIAHLMNVLHLDVSAGSRAGPIIGEAAILRILDFVFPKRAEIDNHEHQHRSDRQVRVACDYIEANLSRRLSLIDIAKTVDLSARQLTRAFQSTIGLSPHAYIIQRRVARARTLIAQGHLSLAAIADAVGFSSHAHMTATFQKVLGAVPSHFCNSALYV